MILAFVMLFAGGMLLGGTWSFYRTRKPWWATVAMAALALLCIGVSVWRLQSG